MKPKILAIDDDQIWLEQVPDVLNGIAEVYTASSINEGLEMLSEKFFDVCLLDLNFTGDPRTGLDLFRSIQVMDRGVDVIMLSGETDADRLIEVFNFGLKRFIKKTSSIAKIRVEVSELLKERDIKKQVLSYERRTSSHEPLNPLLGVSPAITKLRNEVSMLIEAGVMDILVQGETGTGKEKLARYIAYKMDPAQRFIPLHCGAIAEGIAESELFGHVKGSFTGANDQDRIGVFEAAGGGYVFLDEIGEMPPSQQTKLLRVLQERTVIRVGSFEERKVNFRTISASNINLEESVKNKKFREDLLYRISKAVIKMPALRERIEDMPMILDSFKLKTRAGLLLEFSPEAIRVLKSYYWPGNIRQLQQVAEKIARFAETQVIRPADIYRASPEFVTAGKVLNGGSRVDGLKPIESERMKFLIALDQAGGRRDDAAKILGLSRATFFRRLKDLGIGKER